MPRWLLLLLVVLAGCDAVERFALRNTPEDHSTVWRYGYADGCWSGRRDGQRKERDRDVARYRSDVEYRDGWDTGYRECLARAAQEPTATMTPTDLPTEMPQSPTPEVPTPAEATPAAQPTNAPEPTHAPEPTRAPEPTHAPSTPASSVDATRRQEIENRMRELRGEMKSLEGELETLPK